MIHIKWSLINKLCLCVEAVMFHIKWSLINMSVCGGCDVTYKMKFNMSVCRDCDVAGTREVILHSCLCRMRCYRNSRGELDGCMCRM